MIQIHDAYMRDISRHLRNNQNHSEECEWTRNLIVKLMAVQRKMINAIDRKLASEQRKLERTRAMVQQMQEWVDEIEEDMHPSYDE